MNPADQSIIVLTLDSGDYRVYSEAAGRQRLQSWTFPELELTSVDLFGPPRIETPGA